MFWEAGVLVRDYGTPPGIYGDSCNETGNFWTLVQPGTMQEFRPPEPPGSSLYTFRTVKGYIRHPLVPEDWKEADFSCDQALPLLTGLHSWGQHFLVDELLQRIHWKTGNGDPVSPVFYAVARRVRGYDNLESSDALLYASALAHVYLPFRWNDEKHWFERTSNGEASTDWKTLFCALYHAETHRPTKTSKAALRLLVRKGFLDQMRIYYKDENPWIIELYKKVIQRIESSP